MSLILTNGMDVRVCIQFLSFNHEIIYKNLGGMIFVTQSDY